MSCASGWYENYFYNDSKPYSSLVPSKLIDCHSAADDSAKQLANMLQVTMLLGMVFLLFVMYRSCNKNRTDWYRLIAVYIAGTIGVPISILLGPTEGGFNRIIGFGILVHNAAEIMILGHIWFGDVNNPKASNKYGAMWILMYVWAIMAMIAFVPEVALFYILMLQGAFCDWSLVGSFIYMGYWMDHDAAGSQQRKEMGCYGKLGAAAAITHILSIHPLFIAIASSWLTLAGATIALLIPTFILYIWFTAADKHHRPIVMQPHVSDEMLLDAQRNRLLKKVAKELRPPPNSENELKQRHQGDVVSGADCTVDVSSSNEPMYPLVSRVMAAVDDRENAAREAAANDKSQRTYGDIIRIGLLNIGSDDDRKSNSKWMKIIAFAAFLVDAIDVTLIFFLPCMVDFSDQVCD